MKFNNINAVSGLVLVTAYALMLLAAYWLWYPYPQPNNPNPEQYEVFTPVVKVGGEVTYRVTSNVSADYVTDVRVLLVNNAFKELDTILGVAPRLGTNEHITTRILPTDIYPGEHYLQFQFTYQPNPIRSITYVIDSEPFTVIP